MNAFPHFIVIGAQKAGTTSMHAWLSASPTISMPVEKELQFFSNEDEYARGMDYYRSLFPHASDSLILGEASPQYLCSKKASERIKFHCPGTKLIAVLRDPVERALSHYRMTVRRGRTRQSLDACIDELLVKAGEEVDEPDMDHDFLAVGLYGRQLTRFAQMADRGQLRVYFLEELIGDSRPLAADIQEYLSPDAVLRLGEFPHAHRGGTARFGRLDRVLRSNGAVRACARFLLTPSQRKALRFRYETHFSVRAEDAPEVLSQQTRERLHEYFSADRILLERFIGRRAPWV
ncbi:sulfotransferase family protein [Lentisalinibacter orientalis]|uniref:sulfotransferase family protein n=1 Tax=Lentisalinibacter orientalis TaxID=2992241 RepID=UPI00386E2FA8